VIAQADINAAINLGLRAIAAPDTTDIHLRIRAKRDEGTFLVRADNKGLCINNRFTWCCVLDQSCSSIHHGIRGSGG
jgi:transposase